MILIDANLLLYAYDEASPRHDAARAWFERVLTKDRDVRLGLATILAFLRLSTDSRIFERPLSPAQATAIVDSWLARKNVSLALPAEGHWSRLGKLAEQSRSRGPLLMDAHLASLTIERGGRLATTDRDFTRFPGLTFNDPIERSSARP
jgi:toxin-antitoxin system PIN domain toxin